MIRANLKAVSRIETDIVSELEKRHTVAELDPKEFTSIKIKGILHFHVKQYRIQDVGNLSLMSVNAGLMQMLSAVLTPLDKDVPAFSLDYIYMLGRRKAYVEIIDLDKERSAASQQLRGRLGAVAASYADLENVTPASSWQDDLILCGFYKAGKARDDDRLFTLQKEILDEMLAACDNAPLLDSSHRGIHIADVTSYFNNLISRGGVSTDVFKASLGEEERRDFFSKVFFGVCNT